MGIGLVITGLLFSKPLISIGSFGLFGNWLLEGDLKNKFGSFFKNKIALAISALFIIHVLGMIYTNDIAYGLKDIRIKIPLLLFPLVFSTSKPLTQKEYNFFHLLFLMAVFISTVISTVIWMQGKEAYLSDIRSISIFNSHIRFSLMIALAFFISAYYFMKSSRIAQKTALFIPICWFPIFLLILESFTGLVVVGLTAVVFVFHFLWKSSRKKLIGVTSIVLIITSIALVFYLKNLLKEFHLLQTNKELPFREVSENGERYSHPANNNPNPSRQNGYIVYQNIAWDELIDTWNSRSRVNFDSNAFNGYPVKHVILWHLASKGWNKDAEAVEALSMTEINAIERGIANNSYLNRLGVEARVLETFWEIQQYQNGGDFNGHSVMMRWEFWKTALSIIRENLFIGVGTGDIKQSFAMQYEKDNSLLTKKWRLRSHNQYLSLAVAFGIVGLLIALYSLLSPLYHYKHHRLYVTFSCILLLSMINEDTLETQTGATLFAFFNSFYLFLDKDQPKT